jgi:toxin ParE1/3/4
MIPVIWSPAASQDTLDIVDWIARDAPLTAQRVLTRLEAKAAGLERFPARGRVVPELRRQGITDIRQLVCAPWRIIYRLRDHEVRVISVFHARRDLQDVLLHRALAG